MMRATPLQTGGWVPGGWVPRGRGTVLVMMLLALMLLSSAVFFIFNVGVHLQKRTETQNAADAAVGAGAGWVARTLNLVAMNNVEMTKLLAQVQVLDAIPEAIGDSLDDHAAALRGVERQLRVETPGHAWLDDGLTRVAVGLDLQVTLLEELDQVLITGPEDEGSYDIAELTHYTVKKVGGGTRRGKLWEAMFGLDAISRAALANVGELAQVSAVSAASGNLDDSGADNVELTSDTGAHGFLVPFVPAIPWEEGEFDDFGLPLIEGVLPLGIDDEEFSRGPFDVIFGWRHPQVRVTESGTPTFDLALDDDYGLREFHRQGKQPTKGEVIGYTNYGPYLFYANQLNRAEAEAMGESENHGAVRSWLAERARGRADWKMNELVEPMDRGPLRNRARLFGTPSWNSNYAARTLVVNAGGDLEDLFIFVEFSAVPIDTNGRLDGEPVMEDWGLWPFGGPARRNTADLGDQIGERVWRVERRLHRIDSATGVRTDYVQWVYLVWCAADLNPTPAEIRNPNNFTSDDPLPVPLRLVDGAMEHDDAAARDRYLRFFAAAEQPARAPFWSALFDGEGDTARPVPRVTATASAVVFNNHSWDLWTQMWHAQLVPVEDLDAWLKEMRKTGLITEDIPFLDVDQIGRTHDYLETIAPLLKVVGDVENPR